MSKLKPVSTGIRFFYLILGFLFLFYSCSEQKTQETIGEAFPQSAPELESVSSQGILDFLQAIDTSQHELHSFMFLRHGKIIAQGWWSPYRADLVHTMYSTSKSFTSTAAGFAVNEGLFSLEDKVISFFPDDLPDTVSDNLGELNVKHLLMMSAGMVPDPTRAVVTTTDNWIRGFLATPIVNKPGTEFLYNSLATYMVSAIIQKVAGMPVLEYLKPRLFEPLGIEGVDWEIDPQGINSGGWGLRLKTEDMAKFGQTLLQKGMWKGQQVIPAEWVEQATSAQIYQAPEAKQSVKDNSDWLQGYGYQFWRCRNNAFRADGAFGQYIIVLPEKEAVVILTSETPDMQAEINLVWQHLLPAMKDAPMSEDPEKTNQLKERLASLSLDIPESAVSDNPETVQDIVIDIKDNPLNMSGFQLSFEGQVCRMTINERDESYVLSAGNGKWVYGETTRPGPYLISIKKDMYAGLPPLKVAGSYEWETENILVITLRYIESPHTEIWRCLLNEQGVDVEVHHSFWNKDYNLLLQGERTN